MTTAKPNPTDPGYGFNEFQWDAVYQKTWRDTCGEFALEHAEAQADGKVANVTDMLTTTHDMIHQGLRKVAGGGTTLYGLAREAEFRKYTILVEWDYESNFNHDWHATIKEHAGKNPIVLFFTNGQALVDAETGIGYSYRTPWKPDFVNHPLSGHFIEVADVFEEGYLCVDGANPQVLSRYQVYRYDTLNAAQVRGLLVLKKKVQTVTTPKPTTPPTPAPVPNDYEKIKADAIAAEKARDELGAQLKVANAKLAKAQDALAAVANLLHPYADVLQQVLDAQKS